MKSLEELKEYYQNELVKDLEPLESKRSIYSNINLAIFIIGILSVLILFTAKDSGVQLSDSVFIILILGVALLYSSENIGKRMTKDFSSDYREQVMSKIINFLEPDLVYRPTSYINEDYFQMSKLFLQEAHRYTGKDLVRGILDKTKFRFSQVHAEYKTEEEKSEGGKNIKWHTIFRGLFFIGYFNKNFKGKTFVLPDLAESLLGDFGSWLQSINITRDQLVRLEDPEFEKSFVVYSNDQIEARYILSTSLMQRIVQFNKKFKTLVYISFVRSRVFVAISLTEDMFQPKLNVSILNSEVIEKFYEDLNLGLDIINDLNLNTRLWSKE